jgi:hypothetical protein
VDGDKGEHRRLEKEQMAIEPPGSRTDVWEAADPSGLWGEGPEP